MQWKAIGRLVTFLNLASFMACTTPGEPELPIPSVLVSPGDQDPFDPNQSGALTIYLLP
jgi:hypothetical protein